MRVSNPKSITLEDQPRWIKQVLSADQSCQDAVARGASARVALGQAPRSLKLDLRSIKTVRQMDILRCKTPPMVQKEIAAHLLAYNLVRSVMAKAAFLAGLLPRQLSFKGALQLLRAFEQNLRHSPCTRLIIRQAHLLAGVAQMKLPYRPWRVEPRAVKRRPKTYKWLTQPRKIVRALGSLFFHTIAKSLGN